MRQNVSQIKIDGQLREEKSRFNNNLGTNKRLDLNDLLKRVKDRKKNDKKINLLIFSGAASLVLVVFLLLSL